VPPTLTTLAPVFRPARYEDRDYLCDRLAETFRATSRDEWTKLFDYEWSGEKPDFGVVMEIDGAIRGYLGAIHSHRVRPDGVKRVVNMIGWWVDPTLRGGGLGRAIVDAWMALYASCTTTMLTFRHDHLSFWHQHGVERFDLNRRVVLVRPWWLSYRGAMELSPDRVTEDAVGSEPFRILRDHQPLRCTCSVFQIGDRAVVVISRKRTTNVRLPDWYQRTLEASPVLRRMMQPRTGSHGIRLQLDRARELLSGRFPLAEILYVSDPAALAQVLPAVVTTLARKHRALGLLSPLSWLGSPRLSCLTPVGHYYFRSPDLAAEEIDALYCEFLLMQM